VSAAASKKFYPIDRRGMFSVHARYADAEPAGEHMLKRVVITRDGAVGRPLYKVI